MSRIKVGVIGLGDHGVRHTRLFAEQPEAEVVAVSSRDPERAKAVAAMFDIPRWYSDYRDLVQDPEVQAVDVVTEVSRHAEVVLAALGCGKHVLVEKPMSST